MGKAKKGKRTDKDDEVDSDFEVEEQVNNEPAKSKSKAKDKKKKKGDDIDEITEEMGDLKVDKKPGKKEKKSKKGGEDSDEEMDSVVKSKGRKGSSAPNVDGGSDSEAETSKAKQKNKKKGKKNQEESEDEDEEPRQKGKKNKKGKKGGHDDTEDEEEEDQKQKGKKGKKGKKQVESDDSDFDGKKPKGKSKKGKKNLDSEGSEDEEESVKGKSKGKKGKKVDSDEEVEEKKGKAKGRNKGRKASESEDDFTAEKAKPAKGNKAPAGRGGFALLDLEGDDDDENDEEPPYESENESEKTTSVDRSKNVKPQPAQDPKKGKKGKKKRNESDEDIDKVLAELELEYAGQKKDVPEVPKVEEDDKKKGKGKEKEKKVEKDEAKDEEDQEGGTVKSAAQKKKEKKERERQKKLAQKKAEAVKKGDEPKTEKPESEAKVEKAAEKAADKITEDDAEDGEGGTKKKKGAKEDPKDKVKGPSKKAIQLMQEALKQAKEEEERLQREEEERIRLEEAREDARLLAIKLEQEKKDKKKLKEKQRKERLKAEGKLLTPKQKQAQLRAQMTLENLKASGLLPDPVEKKPRPGTRIKSGKMKSQTSTEEKDEKKEDRAATEVQVEIVDKQQKPEEEKEDEVKDSWDAESSDEPEEDKSDEGSKDEKQNSKVAATPAKDSSDNESESDSDSESDEGSDDDSGADDKISDAQRKKEKARLRIETRRKEAEKKKTLDDLRAGVVCVLGHVDTGKTKILDKLRRTNVQDGEAGGITQQIGATNVPIEAIHDSTRHVKGFADKQLKIPGLLIIDTPGHESFSNLRNRGSSLCDIAILVVDIMHGLEPQTIESINLLKAKKTHFVVALNKIDRIYDWNSVNRKDVQDIIKTQSINSQREFEKRAKEVIVQFAEQGLNAALFYENPDPRSYVSLVPTSAITGEGMGNLLAMIVEHCQGPLAKKLMYSEELQATVLEVKALPGLGTTIDCILVNGKLREGDTMIVAGTDGPIVTTIRSLLMPQPMKELRVKNAYVEYREIKAAQGVKICAKDLEKAIAGLNLQVAQKPDEVEVLRDEIAQELSHVLGNIKLAERGVFVQASTLGALEALLDFLKTSKIPYAGIRIGPVVKKDVMKASIMLEHDSQYATILAFDVKIEKDAQELADSIGVKIFQADIIYHLFDKFTAYREELRQRKRDEHKHIAVFPCKLKVMPTFVFKTRDPIVAGVMVEAGIIRPGTPVCVPSKEFLDLGVVTSVEMNHKPVEFARKGQEVCIKIEPVPGEAPKMFGRHFDEKDFIISKISRQSIDACKDYFRDDLLKTDWQLMVELKKLFQIL